MVNMKVKQVIVIRKDLKMRRGKEIAQSCHASISHLLNHFKSGKTFADLTEAQQFWYNTKFRKICCYVESEEALVQIHEQALAAGLPSRLVEDEGLTEFNGVKTKTCIAIGPAEDEQIDLITGKLPLY